MPLPGEVLVELAAHPVEPLGDPEDAGAEVGRELVQRRLGPVGDAAEPALGDGDEQAADRRVGEVVGDVDQAFALGGLAEAAVEIGGNVHEGSFSSWVLRRRRTPAEAAWRAASSEEPSAAPIAAYGRS